MEFSFGILTAGGVDLTPILDSIVALKIPQYEILVIGGPPVSGDVVIHIPFDESIKRNWITRKKNLLCQHAKYENVVLLHDYVVFEPDWYTGFLSFGNDFELCINRILNTDNSRYRDYTIFPGAIAPYFQQRALLPYTYVPPAKAQKIMYISGTYYVIKRSLALRIPLDERRVHGGGEDVYFCKVATNAGVHIKCNPHSTVKFLKYKIPCSWEKELTLEDISTLEGLSEEEYTELSQRQSRTV